jgi:hypothetical protein
MASSRSTTDLERTVATRVSKSFFGKIEKFQEKLAAKTPGVKINQSDAIRVLLEKAITAEGL